ncbi:MAG: acyltransferase [Bacteroidota bacterium]
MEVKMGYIKQIDFLRAVAILAVVTTHWSSPHSLFYEISTAISGPFIFFTISGFLITRILISERLLAEVSHQNKLTVFKNFFIRRGLRIFAIYYLAIIIVHFLNQDNLSNYYSYLTYTTNFHQNATQSWGVLPHLWTMAVEEQFYIFWPFIILFIPQKLLLPTIVLFILIGIGSRVILETNDFAFTLPYTCFDALGLGALLAWFQLFKFNYLPKLFKLLGICAIASTGCLIWSIGHQAHLYIFHRTFIAIVTSWTLLFFIVRRNYLTSKYTTGLENTLSFIGKISYGIFLFHIPLIEHSNKILGPVNKLILGNHQSNTIFLLENFMLLILISWLSWKFFELPISNLKRYFKTEKAPALQPVATVKAVGL